MDRSLICVERPVLGMSEALYTGANYIGFMRAYIPIGVDDYVIVHCLGTIYWAPYQAGFCCRSKLRQMKVFSPNYNEVAVSFPVAAWGEIASGINWRAYDKDS